MPILSNIKEIIILIVSNIKEIIISIVSFIKEIIGLRQIFETSQSMQIFTIGATHCVATIKF